MRFHQFILGILAHSLVAVVGSAIVGFFISILLSPLQEDAFLPAALIAGTVVGYIASKKVGDVSACFAWILPLASLIWEILDDAKYFSQSWAHTSLSRYIWDNYFGTACGGSECLDELFFTAPFLSTVAYSVVAFYVYLKNKGSSSPEQSLSQEISGQ